MMKRVFLIFLCILLLFGTAGAYCPYGGNSYVATGPSGADTAITPDIDASAIISTGTTLPDGFIWPAFPAPAGSSSGGLIRLNGLVPGQIGVYTGAISAKAYQLRPTLSPLPVEKAGPAYRAVT